MWCEPAPEPGAPPRRRDEGGFTLIEVLIAMGLMSILVAIFMGGVVQMTKATVRVQNVSNSAEEARRIYDRFDRQLRVASEVNRPVQVGQIWYLEFRTSATGTGTTTCSQWRLDGTTDKLQIRTWTDVASPTVGSWTTIGSRVINNVSTQVPFAVSPADSTFTRQRVSLFIAVSNGQPGGSTVSGTVVARNTSTTSSTNLDVNSDGVSDTQVCQQAGRPTS